MQYYGYPCSKVRYTWPSSWLWHRCFKRRSMVPAPTPCPAYAYLLVSGSLYITSPSPSPCRVPIFFHQCPLRPYAPSLSLTSRHVRPQRNSFYNVPDLSQPPISRARHSDAPPYLSLRPPPAYALRPARPVTFAESSPRTISLTPRARLSCASTALETSLTST